MFTSFPQLKSKKFLLFLGLIIVSASVFFGLNAFTLALDVKPSSILNHEAKVTKPMTALIVVKQPNEFTLTTDREIFITYSTVTGVPQLDYKTQLNNGNHHFSGQEIVKQDTEIGTLLTVVVERPQNPDIGGTQVKLTVVIPNVNLLPKGGEAKVNTEAILTTQKVSGNIRTPKFGQIQTYQVLPLTGTARFVAS